MYVRTFYARCKHNNLYATTFFMRVIYLREKKIQKKKKEKKELKKNANAKPSYISQSFETYTNVLKPSVSLPRLL